MMATKDTAAALLGQTAQETRTATDATAMDANVDAVVRKDAELAVQRTEIEAKDAEIARLQGELQHALSKAGRKPKAVKAEVAAPVDAGPDAKVFANGGGAAGADFDGETPMLTGKALWDLTQAGPCYILFGDTHHAYADLAPVRTNPEHWEKRGDRSMFTGTITLAGSNVQASGLMVSHFALAVQPDGPVVALCEIPGGANVAAGREFAFIKGNILFG